MAELPDARTPRVPLFRRPWAPAVLATAVAVAVGVPTFAGSATRPDVVLVVLLALAFVVTTLSTMDVEFRRQTYVFSPVEFPLVIGLVEVGGLWTAVARVLALAIVILRQPYARPKSAFNLALALVEVAVASAVVQFLSLTSVADPVTWAVLVLAVVAVGVVDVLMVGAAIALVEGRPPNSFWLGALAPSLVVGPLCVAIAVVALLVTDEHPSAWFLLGPVLAGVLLVFRQSATAVRERRSVQSVHDFARRVEAVAPDEGGTRELVRAVRELLNADRVALWLPPYLDEGPRLVVDRAGDEGTGTPGRATPTTSSADWRSTRTTVAPSCCVRPRRTPRSARPCNAARPRRSSAHRSSPRPGSTATSRCATGRATSCPSSPATAPHWTRCSPTSTPPSASSSC
ncbi:hypothetical protein ACFQX8_27030 [Klenkia terrae]|uniref:hypothetical protein n=1 Tax=Klenkia terrae TaxID=1052259 RepID=UPI003623AE5E